MNKIKHVVCAVSGGIDSAIAAFLLKKQGYRVTGCFMRNWNERDEVGSSCSTDTDEDDARFVCEKLSIPFISVDFSKSYWNQVFCQFLYEYEKGMTPNPDILCNKFIKFPMLYNYCVEKFGQIDCIATGHYANVKFDPCIQKHRLFQSRDQLKDQTFFLSQIDTNLLKKILFPIGDLVKSEVRKMGIELGLERIVKKHSSVGICFIGKRNFSSFIDEYLPKQSGSIIDLETDEFLGHHDGVHHFTIGQRIAPDDKLNKNKNAYFVAKKDISAKVIYAVQGTDHPALYYNEFVVDKPHWICEDFEKICLERDERAILNNNFDFKFQNKHVQTPVDFLEKRGSDYTLKLKHPFRAISPGQFAVFYKQSECIGSAKILSTPKSLFDLKYSGVIENSDRKFTKNY